MADGQAEPGGAGRPSPHDRILDAAERCFERWGAAKTSIDDVAAEAGLSRATVYRYIGNRSELITALGIRTWDREEKDWHVSFADRLPNRERVVSALMWSREWVLSFAEPSLAQALSRSERFREYSHDGYVALLDHMREAGELEPGTDLEALAAWILFIRTALWADTTSSPDELRSLLTRFLLPHLGPGAPAPAPPAKRRATGRAAGGAGSGRRTARG
jgi:AcrR family transcriptional regulator